MAFHSDDISINTVIGAGAAVGGSLKVNGFIRIDGDIDGDVHTTGKVITGEHSRIRGSIVASSVIAGGIVEGDIIAPERIQLLSTAAVLGDVSTRRLEVAEHVLLHGYCISRKDEAGYEQAEKNRAERKAIAQRSLEQRTGNA